MINLLRKLDYERYYEISHNLFIQNGIKNKLLPLESEKEDEALLYNCNFFNRGALDYFLLSPNIYHLNKLSTTLYNYYFENNKDVILIPYDAKIDAYTRLNNTFVMYVVKMLEKYLTPAELKAYRKEAEEDHIFGLSEELNLSSYFLHIITHINEKKMKVLFIVNNAQLIDRIEMNFHYNRRETFVRFLLTTTEEPKEIYEEAKIINFVSKYNDVFLRPNYIENELEKRLNILERRKFIDTYRKFDISYIDVLINIINNLDDEKEIKKVIANKDKIDDALGFMKLFISTTPKEYKCYTILPFIFASPLGISNETLKQLFINYSDDSLVDNIDKLIALLPSIIYQDSKKNYHIYDNIFVNEIAEIYAFDIFHASNILVDKIEIKDKKDMGFAINYLYYFYRANRKDGLKVFLNSYAEDPLLISMSIIYLMAIYGERACNYLRNYLHLLEDQELAYVLINLYDTASELDLESEYILYVLERIRQIIDDRYTLEFTKDRLHLMFDSLYVVGKIEQALGRELNKIMYHFHALLYSNEYLRLYKEELYDESEMSGAELALEYSRKINNDKIDKKVRYNLSDEFDIYDLKIDKYISVDELYNAKIIFLELLNSYSFNYLNRAQDIVEFYQAFNFHLEINDTLMFYFLNLYSKKNQLNSKVVTYISKRYLDEFKA